ncbi:multifunctional 2',3'-cyclic-nucleotide 2'-phosphodiesterase/5'-nucleotidase/3'-nucleotidase [Bradyrhizobium sp. SSBR45G]|uniref:bifunctional metallophosphatase/5'-nucleotidase n=1 Tax=unclassified Bradyrhizobium TaxID=2631580 RepID=UPI002342B0E6|nr:MULTISPECIES: bifunctional metallophosphatase/5'-nucleotidase [unclassified Bradyrhizobium]GLH79032.1 multifunctional 2',3'-cyclic-nucleotide 2'-phosphodiesterase/5'-nucleotidase/3'-nucleotidase [Bradyrhizobium sp. SSBR45G]GLH86644.1 multifunctional 2',3'-cyclic-nucleotide 2'-phosphodiesterase/5'-nucleotidase/3'-nucleotidase [Bradyrhizobium sp. SSBR45R]
MSRFHRVAIACLVAGLTAASLAGLPVHAEDEPVSLRILAINDFHGNLKPPPTGIRVADPNDPTRSSVVPAGGAAQMASLIKLLSDGQPNTIFVAAGDLIGASPFLSAMFHDEPTIESMSRMGLALSAVGNHEFDEGKDELLRMQNGGCHPTDGCRGPQPFTGAGFHYLAASTFLAGTDKTVFPPYEIRTFEDIPVAFIGLTLKGTAGIISPASAAGLDFRNEAESINALIPELKAKGVQAIVVLIHEGGWPSGGMNECPGLSGPIVDIVKELDSAVDIIISGHTHQAYVCTIDKRLVTSADKFGTLVTAIDVKLDRTTRGVISAAATNIVVDTTLPKDAAQTALIEAYEKLAAPIANRPAGVITQVLSRLPDASGESVLGDVIADAQLAATSAPAKGGAAVAMTNPGGIRTDLARRDDGAVSYGDVFASQPFRNQLVTVTLTGAEIKAALEQQWLDPARPRILQISRGFSYAFDARQPAGARIDAASMSLDGKAIDPAASYRVTLNNYLALGGDGFTTFKSGRDPIVGPYDDEALFAYLKANSPLSPPPRGRIVNKAK